MVLRVADKRFLPLFLEKEEKPFNTRNQKHASDKLITFLCMLLPEGLVRCEYLRVIDLFSILFLRLLPLLLLEARLVLWRDLNSI
jgi:hypothetical protein